MVRKMVCSRVKRSQSGDARHPSNLRGDTGRKVRSDEKRSVTSQRAHNNMFTHVARARCSDACPPVATLVCLTALLMSMQLAPPNPPSTFPTHVDWLMYASMSGSPVPTHINDVPSHPTARMEHQSSPPALLDGTGLLQMPPQRAESPVAKQDNSTNWEHTRSTRSHQRQHEPNETQRHSATHTHLHGSNGGPPTAQSRPILLPQGPLVRASYNAQSPESSFLSDRRIIFTYRRLNCSVCVHTKEPKQPGRHHTKTFSLRFFLISKLIPKTHFYSLFLPPKAPEGFYMGYMITELSISVPTAHTRRLP